jgi:acetylornithine deacetylase/succinyl-diaminopimelate desuccinylase-like protein
VLTGTTFALLASISFAAQDREAESVREVRALAGHPVVTAALELIRRLDNNSETLLIELTEIPAPPFAEHNRARRFATLLQDAGLADTRIDKVGNVIARRPGSDGRATVALVAHLDTVFPPETDVTVRREGDRLYAPGIGDNTRGLVLLQILAQTFEDLDIQTRDDILFVASVGEEGLGDLRGVKHLFSEHGEPVDQMIAIDGGSMSRVLNEAIGSLRYRLRFRGEGGHSWSAFGLANPAHALASAIHEFDRHAATFVDGGPRTTYNIGRIGGGTSVNAVPFESWAEIDLRSADPERLAEIDALLKRSVQQVLASTNARRLRGAELEVELAPIGNRPSGVIAADTPLVQRALAVTHFLGHEPQLAAGSTDANVPISLGIPAVTIGRGGSGGGSHSLQEWWSDSEAYLGVQKALLLTLLSAGFSDSQAAGKAAETSGN